MSNSCGSTMDRRGQSVDFLYQKPEDMGHWKSLSLAIWDPSKRQFLRRTAKSWGAILVFYVIFYLVLAALFTICMLGLLYTIDKREPTYKLSESLIGNNPGMGFRPMAENVDEAGSVIRYMACDESSVEFWVKTTNKFVEPYYKQSTGRNYIPCNYSDKPVADDKVCVINTSVWGPCSPENGYSFNKSSPCVFIKLNKIFGWVPEFYGRTDLPGDMPLELRRYIQNVPENELKTIWVSCNGENPTDIENIGPMVFHGPNGFPGFYFPYTNTEGYLSPLVALQFVRPQKRVLINIECRAWAKNIRYTKEKGEREGSVLFTIKVD